MYSSEEIVKKEVRQHVAKLDTSSSFFLDTHSTFCQFLQQRMLQRLREKKDRDSVYYAYKDLLSNTKFYENLK